MSLLYFLLVPVVLAASLDVTINNFVINIDKGTLTSIQTTGEPSYDLNLSGLGLRRIDTNAFRNLSHVKNLNLGNNSLFSLPESVFMNLTSLEHLSLADNTIFYFRDTFVGLNNLKSLNISNNPVDILFSGSFFGLTKSVDILTHGINIVSIETDLFRKYLSYHEIRKLEDQDLEAWIERDQGPKSKSFRIKYLEDEIFLNSSTLPLDASFRVKLCKTEGIVTSLEVLKNDSELELGCREVEVDHKGHVVSLDSLEITGFNSGWYRLQAYAIESLDIRFNHIVDVTENLLNDLPESVKRVALNYNRIHRLVKGRIANQHLRVLRLSENFISEIEDGALENTRLLFLSLRVNCLSNTKFVATLPNTIERLDLNDNRIQELSAGSFSNRGALTRLFLNTNSITEIKSDSLNGLSSLLTLSFTSNNLRKIAPGSFQTLRALKILDFTLNDLTSLDNGVFTGLESIEYIDLGWNQLTKITRESFIGLPDTLRELYLDYNHIETLENGTFVNVPKVILSLESNKISKIEKGSFNLPSLYKLSLTNNSLSNLDGDAFEGLGKLRYLSLERNGIEKIEKGAMKNLGGPLGLNLSRNPITRLETGAFFGLRPRKGSHVLLGDCPVEVIQGGLFDDV